MTVDETLKTLAALARSGDRVRLGWTLSNGQATKEPEVRTAEDAAVAVRALYATAESLGLGVASLSVWRVGD